MAVSTMAREAAGMNRAALASAADLDPSYLMRIERGQVVAPAWKTIVAIAEAMNLPLDHFR